MPLIPEEAIPYLRKYDLTTNGLNYSREGSS